MGLKVKENGKWVSIGKVKYTIAKDSDFSGPANSESTRYIGESTNIVMPKGLGGTDFTIYSSLFRNKTFEKLSVISINSITSMLAMFSGCSSLIEIDLSAFDTSQVTSMTYMFRACSSLKTVYARTEADANKFRNSFGFPSGATVIVK